MMIGLTLGAFGCWGAGDRTTATTNTPGANADLAGVNGNTNSGSSDGGSTGNNNTGGSGDMECGGQEFALTRIPPNVMLVLDRSGSMSDSIASGSKTTKYADLTTAMQSLVSTDRKSVV